MSFAFHFNDDELDEEYLNPNSTTHPPPPATTSTPQQTPFREWPLSDLLDSLPSRISYSPINLPLDPHNRQHRHATLMRRDLFDARFQMLLDQHDEEQQQQQQQQQQQHEETQAVAGVDSDLVPGLYEGGLKTWECSLDLVATLDQRTRSFDWSWLHGKAILELGCGTAIPSLFILQQLLNIPPSTSSSSPSSSSAPTTLHLCDYNHQVLRLVTLPNILLAWYFSNASEAYRISSETLQARQEESKQLKSRGQDHFDTAAPSAAAADQAGPGELSLDEPLFEAFQKSLAHRNISLRFFSGSWQGLQPAEILATDAHPELSTASTDAQATSARDAPFFDLILSAETIYSLDALPLLTDVLRRSCKPSQPTGLSDLNERLARFSLSQTQKTSHSHSSAATADEQPSTEGTLCLIGAKVLYFGVGGGVEAFKQHVEAPPPGSKKGWTETVRTISQGVGRVVLSVGILPDQL